MSKYDCKKLKPTLIVLKILKRKIDIDDQLNKEFDEIKLYADEECYKLIENGYISELDFSFLILKN